MVPRWIIQGDMFCQLAIGKRPPREIEGLCTFKDLTEFGYL